MFKQIALWAAVLSLSLTFTSCDLINGGGDGIGGDVDNEAELAKLAGEWVRVKSNNPANDGMVLTVAGSMGTITENPKGGFDLGDVKWNNLMASAENMFDYEELGSDNNYYAASMDLDGDTVFLTVESSGAGNIQRWVKRAKYTEPAATTVTLDCNDLPATLSNTEAEIDYIVPAGCVLDVTDPLTIDAGTVIVFEENAGIGVYDNGSIKAVGTATNPIVMRGMNDVRGYWRGIHVETNSLDNVFEYVEVSNAGANYVYCCNRIATLFLKGGKMKIQHSTFSMGDGEGIYADRNAEFIDFQDVTVTTHSEHAMYLHLERLGELDGSTSTFTGNDQDFIYVYKSTLQEDISVPAQGVPYLFEGAVMNITADLELQAGVEIALEENGGIGVYDNGTFKSAGSAGKEVIIRGKERVKGYWRGIHIETNSSKNDLQFTHISDAGGDYVFCCNTVASLYIKGGIASLSNCRISNGDSYGISAVKDFSFSKFDNNLITTHKEEPMFITMVQAGQLDGQISDFSGNEKDGILIYRSDVSDATTIKKANVPYIVDNNVVINIVNPIVFEAGAEIVFAENAGLGVYDNGTITANGTDTDEVVFRGMENVQGYWRGIHTETNSSNNVLDHVRIDNAGSNYVYCCNDVAALYLRDGSMTLTNSTINQSGGCGVFVRSAATFTENNNTYSNNKDGNVCN